MTQTSQGGGFEQEIAEGTERKAFPSGLSSVLSVASCWKFQIRTINVRRRYGRGTQAFGIHAVSYTHLTLPTKQMV